MPIFNGNTSTSATSISYDIPSRITFFSLVNKTGGTVKVDVAIVYGSSVTYILYQHSITSADPQYNIADPILLLDGRSIYVSVNGSTDYYFAIE